MGKIGGIKNSLTKETSKPNCWEFHKCERCPGGKQADKLGVCPASTDKELDGAHGGTNAGRSCWVVAGTLCGGKIQGTQAKKLRNCWKCEFMNSVKRDEETTRFGFSLTRLGMVKMLEKMKKESPRPKTLPR